MTTSRPTATSLAAIALLLFIAFRPAAAADSPAPDVRPISGDDVLAVSIAIPPEGAEGQRIIRYLPGNLKSCVFDVVLTNLTDRPQRVFQDWNSWGYYNLSFEITGADGKVQHVQKGGHDWTKNFPSWWDLPPHETRVLAVHFADTDTWAPVPFPKPAAGPETYTMRAIFETPPSDPATKNGVWTGHIVSKAEKYTFASGR